MNRLLEVDVTLLTFVLGSLVPLLTAVLTKVRASSGVKAIVNVLLSVVTGTASYWLLHDGKSTLVGLATAAITAYLASGVTYEHLWKPTNVAPSLHKNTAEFGVG